MRYIVRARYFCNEANRIERIPKQGTWIAIETTQEIQKGVTDKFILPPHGCKRYYYSQLCEEDQTCNNQEILEIKNYSAERADQMHLSLVHLEVMVK